MKKKTKKTIGITILLLLFAVIVASLMWFVPARQSAIIINVNAISGAKCPVGYSCQAQPIMHCQDQTGNTPLVKLRTDDGGDWFAYDVYEGGNLEYYEKGNNYVNFREGDRGGIIYGCVGGYCFGENSPYSVINRGKLSQDRTRLSFYKLVENPPYDKVSPTPSGNSRYLELIEGGTNVYFCEEPIFINGGKVDSLVYSGEVGTPSNGIKGVRYLLQGGDEIQYRGDVEWSQSKIPTKTCQAPTGEMNTGEKVCDGNTLYVCDSDSPTADVELSSTNCAGSNKICVQSSSVVASCEYEEICETNFGDMQVGNKQCQGSVLYSCDLKGFDRKPTVSTKDCSVYGEICDSINLVCDTPYEVSLKLDGKRYSSGIVQILSSSTLEVELTIIEPEVQRRNVIVSLLDGSSVVSTISDNSNRETRTITIPTPSITGYYDLKIYMAHENGDYEKTITVQAITPVETSVASPNPVQYDNEEILITMNTYQGGVKVPVFDYEFDATFRNQKVSPITTRNPSRGLYEAYFNVNGEGTLRVRAKAQYEQNGAWSEYSDFYTVDVKEASITISPNFQTDIVQGSYVFSFETRDSAGNLVPTTNTIVIEGQGMTMTSNANPDGASGKYNFDATFPSGGLYYIKITSVNPTLGSSQLNNGLGLPVNVFSNGGGGGDDPFNWIMWSLFGVLFMGIVLIGYALYKGKKKGGKK